MWKVRWFRRTLKRKSWVYHWCRSFTSNIYTKYLLPTQTVKLVKNPHHSKHLIQSISPAKQLYLTRSPPTRESCSEITWLLGHGARDETSWGSRRSTFLYSQTFHQSATSTGWACAWSNQYYPCDKALSTLLCNDYILEGGVIILLCSRLAVLC